MKKLLAKLWLRVCPLRPIYVKFYSDCGWSPAWAFFGVYHAVWWAGPFPLRLTLDGHGIMLRRGMRGSGKPYPSFQWCPRKWRAAH